MGNDINSSEQELLKSMDKVNSNSAERELLKAIEDDPGSREAGKSANLLKKNPMAALDPFIEKIKRNASSGLFSINLQEAKKILFVLLAILLLWLGLSFFKGLFNVAAVPNFRGGKAQAVAVDATGKDVPVKGYTYYADVLLGRNIFKPVEEKEEVVVTQDSGISRMAKDLKIAGLAWSPDDGSKYAMIEDTKTGITYFVQEGDTVSFLKVSKIMENQVVLKHMSEEIVLR